MMDSTPNAGDSMGGGRLFDLTEDPDFPATANGTTQPSAAAPANDLARTNGHASFEGNGVSKSPAASRQLHFTPVTKDVAPQLVRKFFRALLEGSPTKQNTRTVRAAGEWPRMLVDEYFDRLVSPSQYAGMPTSAGSESNVPSLQKSGEQAGSGRVTMRDAFAGFIWSS